WRNAIPVARLAERSWQVMQRRRPLLADLPEDYQRTNHQPADWLSYWKKNPITAWVGGRYFSLEDELFIGNVLVDEPSIGALSEMVQELVDFRLATYAARSGLSSASVHPLPNQPEQVELPYFPSLKIACGHFRTSRADYEEYRPLSRAYGNLDPSRHFLARASGHSMDGGKQPIRDGDYLLLEVISSGSAGKITGEVLAIERQDEAGDNQYLLRKVLKDPNGQYRLRAFNPDYNDLLVSAELQEQFRTFARLKAVIDPREMHGCQCVMRNDITPLFVAEFNAVSWNSGHVIIPERKDNVLLVTLNKQGKAEDLLYQAHWTEERHFHWQTQNQTAPD